jgi:hypothetical protein
MKKFYIKKMVTAVLFLIIVFIFSFLNFKNSYKSLGSLISDYKGNKKESGVSTLISEIENTINEKVYGKYSFIEIYGYLQKLMGKNEANNFEIVRAEDGSLHYTYFTNGPNPVDSIVERMTKLNEAAQSNGAKAVYIMTPDKYIVGQTEFPRGIPHNYANETADNFLKMLQKNGVDTIDYRELLKNDGMYNQDIFYKTDHHWTVETTFWAFTKLVDTLENKYGETFPNRELYTDINNYNQITYKDSYIGSIGRKVGKIYAGVEDYTFIFPKFDTSYSFYEQAGSQDINLEGKFENTIVFPGLLSGDLDEYEAENDKYFSYMNGNPGYVEIINNNVDNGLKVLFIKDSLMVPVASFFSTCCSRVYMIDPRYYSGSIEDIVKQYDLDYVFVSFSPQNLTDEFFTFFKD